MKSLVIAIVAVVLALLFALVNREKDGSEVTRGVVRTSSTGELINESISQSSSRKVESTRATKSSRPRSELRSPEELVRMGKEAREVRDFDRAMELLMIANKRVSDNPDLKLEIKRELYLTEGKAALHQ